MIESRREVDLGEKSLAPQHGGQLRAEHLEGDVAVVLEVVGQVDRGHAALAELALEPVAVLKGGGQARQRRCQGTAYEGSDSICGGSRHGASETHASLNPWTNETSRRWQTSGRGRRPYLFATTGVQ